jgi:cytochrome c551/c552/cytochrome c5
MFRFSKTLIAAVLAVGATSAAAFDYYVGIGREATSAEVQAWDIDVRPDFVGLPPGKGTADQGEILWEAQCASCHGIFGESNEVFAPLVGGTTKADIKSGRVASLADGSFPQRTTMMKVPTVATLFDYIRRAMPWTNPKSLSDDETYALVAYMLYLSEIIEPDYELNEETIREVQELLPNRYGMTTDHGMWPGAPESQGGIGNGGVPDVRNVLCMKDCKDEVELVSALPEHARDAHGNLADQNRGVGPVRGQQTVEPTGEDAAAGPSEAASGHEAAKASGCLACHGLNNRIVGPSFAEIESKYRDQADIGGYIADRIRKGGHGVWGSVPMPPQGHLTDEVVDQLTRWIMSGAKAQ